MVLALEGLSPSRTYQAWAEFSPVNGPPTFPHEEVLPGAGFEDAGLMRGTMSDENTRVTFHRDGKGWHYGWMAGRTLTSNVQHEMRIYVMEEMDSYNVKPIFTIASTPFRVVGRKRVRATPSGQAGARVKSNANSSANSEDDDDGDDARPLAPPPPPAPAAPRPAKVVRTSAPSSKRLQTAHPSGAATAAAAAAAASSQQQQQQQQQQPHAYFGGMGPPPMMRGMMPPLAMQMHMDRFYPPRMPAASDVYGAQVQGADTPLDYGVLDLLWQPTPPNTVAHMLLQRGPAHENMLTEQHIRLLQQQYGAMRARPEAPSPDLFFPFGPRSPDSIPPFFAPPPLRSPDSMPPIASMIRSPDSYPPILRSPDAYPPSFVPMHEWGKPMLPYPGVPALVPAMPQGDALKPSPLVASVLPTAAPAIDAAAPAAFEERPAAAAAAAAAAMAAMAAAVDTGATAEHPLPVPVPVTDDV